MTSGHTPSETLFPFNCENPNCAAIYDARGFYHVALLWGYICLFSGKENFIGITCPKCHKTTVNRYKLPCDFLTPEDFKKFGFFRDPHGNINIFEDQVVVPFSPKIIIKYLNHLGLEIPELSTAEGIEFSLPTRIKFNPLSKQFYNGKSPTGSSPEYQVGDLCRFENSSGYKIIPRINHRSCLYSHTDNWFGHHSIKSLREISKNPDLREIHDITDPIFRIDVAFQNFSPHGDYSGLPLKSNISPEVLEELEFGPDVDEFMNPNMVGYFSDFLNDYQVARNRLDFEISYRPEFLDKHVTKIFARYYMDREEYAEYWHAGEVEAAQKRLADLLGDTALNDIDANKQPGMISPANRTSTYKESDNFFIRDGAIWHVQFYGKQTNIKNTKRLTYLILLLDKPCHAYNNKALQRDADSKYHSVFRKATGPSLADRYEGSQTELIADAFAKGEVASKGDESDVYREENKAGRGVFEKTLVEEVDSLGFLEQRNATREEIESQKDRIEKLRRHLREEYDISFVYKKYPSGSYKCTFSGGKATLTDDSERARKNIRQNITTAIVSIKDTNPQLSSYLDKCIALKQSHAIYNPDHHDKLKNIRFHIEW